jgi:hypothetical protein
MVIDFKTLIHGRRSLRKRVWGGIIEWKEYFFPFSTHMDVNNVNSFSAVHAVLERPLERRWQ